MSTVAPEAIYEVFVDVTSRPQWMGLRQVHGVMEDLLQRYSTSKQPGAPGQIFRFSSARFIIVSFEAWVLIHVVGRCIIPCDLSQLGEWPIQSVRNPYNKDARQTLERINLIRSFQESTETDIFVDWNVECTGVDALSRVNSLDASRLSNSSRHSSWKTLRLEWDQVLFIMGSRRPA